jgi:hypothetical protein
MKSGGFRETGRKGREGCGQAAEFEQVAAGDHG